MITILIVLVVIGIAWFFLGPYVADPFKTIIIVLVILFFCLWLLSLVGVVPALPLR